MKISDLQPTRGSKKRSKRVGRGNGSGKGTYSTRGMKGQRSRTGGRKGLKLRGLRATFKRIPKLRGFKSLSPKYTALTLRQLDKCFKDGEEVTMKKLLHRSLVEHSNSRIKIIDKGMTKKKLHLFVRAISSGARKKIELNGGTVTIISS